ncbi:MULTISPECIES: dicarboxylate/amino acid:cation symporter [Brevibacillus]|uniref:Dicarboxylate/amino acid:cation symporter n=1 Tax=Brevibacillus invocatus TaxID=173959 RepID=A0A3M8BWJ8_9BACL|nr:MULTISPECIES: dicarboxylate/amino acid:cation symporter [Brevibacillus]MCM3081643.1 dicarboxylate/amino acid:cation symporter [Brevibacillus invocatus]MCM3432004.1 dicarboxylate/amino acid:cation symporter [Brevibacillus invocatus]MDH4619429.1 dicarboxylate/amino acid:cation symporter [Brevibacillus sp. AY1]RNB67808.1 dicarboxylate/amino acid:cation symporter [Brevibacillus invocatus]
MRKLGLLPKILLAIVLGIVIGSFAPEWAVKGLATFSGLFGNFLGFAIPLIIIGFIAPGIGELGKGAGRLLGMTTGVAYISTIIAGLLAYFVAVGLFPHILEVGGLVNQYANPEEALLKPYFTVDMPPIVGVMTALLLAFTFGLGAAVIKGNALQKVMVDLREIVEKLIASVIIPLLPYHIFSVFANLTYGGQVTMILSVFAKVFVIIIALHLIYLLVQYSVAGQMGRKNPFTMLKNMMPAYFTAIGTQSSAATIPVTLRQTKKNGINEKIADFVIPLCATIHLSGSTITLVSCAMAVMMLNGMSTSLAVMFPFILMLGVTMIAAPGVPGGAVMAALGLLESMLGFNTTLTSLMIALYIAQDSFGTACNVTGDGAIAVITDRMSKSETA